MEVVGNLVAFLAALFALLTSDLNGAQVGMSITYAVQVNMYKSYIYTLTSISSN